MIANHKHYQKRNGPKKQRKPKNRRVIHPPLHEDYSVYRQAPSKAYKVVFYDSFAAARADSDEIKTLCSSCDQLNVVIRAEGDMDDPELLRIDDKVKVFSGAAWTLIHERRLEEGWYEASH